MHDGRGSYLVHALHWESSNSYGAWRRKPPSSIQPRFHRWLFLPPSLCRWPGLLPFQYHRECEYTGDHGGRSYARLSCVWNALHGSERHRQLHPILLMETGPWVRHHRRSCQHNSSWGLFLFQIHLDKQLVETHVLRIFTSRIGVWNALGSHSRNIIQSEVRPDGNGKRAFERGHSGGRHLFGTAHQESLFTDQSSNTIFSLSDVALYSSSFPSLANVHDSGHRTELSRLC